MTTSTIDSSTPWSRVLPRPTALLEECPIEPFDRRASSLLQHHLPADRSTVTSWDLNIARRSTIPSISYPTRSISDSSLTDYRQFPAPPSAPLPADRLGQVQSRKRSASHMAPESSSREASPSQTAIAESVPQFCLCQPDPKIPRPRNGMLDTLVHTRIVT